MQITVRQDRIDNRNLPPYIIAEDSTCNPRCANEWRFASSAKVIKQSKDFPVK